ncbi:MAG: Imm26 family immunity protein [Candidatus Wallbacteria bacterium]|nr:Imm26 family immunity protein [Candidatus Wallbacteria bacterium]
MKKIRTGDIFYFQLKQKPDLYWFGRVVNNNAKIMNYSGITMVYIYSQPSRSADKLPELKPDKLLIPPQFINRIGWSKGYFVTILNKPIESNDLLPVNCFFNSITKKNFDDNGKEVNDPKPPFGFQSIGNYRTIEDDVCEALGIPLSDEP